LTDFPIKNMRALITNSNTSNILKGVSGPSWERHTYSSEGGPFSTTISCLCAFGLFLYFGVLFPVGFYGIAWTSSWGVTYVNSPQSVPSTFIISLWYVSFSCRGSKDGMGPTYFLTHFFVCLPSYVISIPILSPSRITTTTLGPSLHLLVDIICTFWFRFRFWFPLAHHFETILGQSYFE